ncbi:hypothetical protein MMC31_005679 [Peltigera leucophlebia]|nr:hypothetical protein [Peltigera leucophlebia]
MDKILFPSINFFPDKSPGKMDTSSEVLQLQEEVCRLKRRVEYLEMGLDATRRELKLMGHNVDKPTFPFLLLPRKVRDQIYHYALMCPAYAKLVPMRWEIFRPPTPGICLVNRQLSIEANKILYSRNTFYFDELDDIRTRLEAIGSINKAHVQSISIWFDYRSIKQCQRDGVSTLGTASDWAMALFGSGLKNLVKIDISTEYVGACSYSSYYPSMDPAMEHAVKYLFRQDQQDNMRHLKLTGFNYDDRKKFPGHWRVTMTQFDPDWIDDPDYAGLMPIPPPEYLSDDESRQIPSSSVSLRVRS